MAFSSVLTPEKITGNKRSTSKEAQRFISGGNILGDSVVASASNKIVGFQRNAGVRPAIPDINSIISSISSNIINNVSNSINTNSQVLNKTIDGKIENFKTEVLQVIRNVENKINSITELSNNKTELINYINEKNIENKQNLLNEIKIIESKIISNKQELINYVSKNNLGIKEQIIKLITEDKKEELIQLINENKRDIVNNKVEIIDYVNTTILQSDLVKKINQLETTVSQVRNEVSQVQITAPPQQSFGGITTQLREIVKNIRENVNETLSKTITNLTTEYRKKVQEVDSAKPTGILQKFIDAYNTAFGFAQFFSNRKNIARLEDNLSAIKDSFTNSFSTAKLLRQVIIKIVKQLSNLPKATSSGGGGFNVDVDIPGPKMKQSLPRNARGMGKGKMLAMGAGALGLGAAGAATVNALVDTGQVQPAAVQPIIPGDVVDQFSIIVDRFTNAVENLIKGATGKKKTQAMAKPSGGGGGGAPSPGSPGSPGGGGGMASDVTADTQEEKAWLQTIRTAEGTAGSDGYGKVFGGQVVKELQEGKLTIEEAAKMSETGKLPDRLGGRQVAYGKYKGKLSGATGAYQFMPSSLRSAAKKAGIDLNTPMTPEVQDKLALAWLQSGGIDPTKRATEATIRSAGQSWGWAGLHGEATGQTKRTVKQSLEMYNKFYGSSKVDPNKTGMGGTSVNPSELAPSAKASIAQSISQPPPSQAEPQVNIMPIDMTGGQQQSASSSSLSPSPSKKTQGPSVPFLPSGNPDNFLLLYSKMVYNIVDG